MPAPDSTSHHDERGHDLGAATARGAADGREGIDNQRDAVPSSERLAPIDQSDPELPYEQVTDPKENDLGAVDQVEPAAQDLPDPNQRVALVPLVDRRTSETSDHPVLYRDCVTAGLTPEAVHKMVEQDRPLGFQSAEQFQRFRDDLDDSLRRVGLRDAEVVLKGTAGTFWSENPVKTFPPSVDDARALAEANAQPPDVAEQRYRDAGYASPDAGLPGGTVSRAPSRRTTWSPSRRPA